MFKIKAKNGYFKYCFLGLPVFKKKDELLLIQHQVATGKNFDLSALDARLAEIAEKIFVEEKLAAGNSIDANKIAFLASEFYNSGGHTECVKSLVSLLKDKYKVGVFLTRKNKTLKAASENIGNILQQAKVLGVDYDNSDFKKNLVEMYRQVLEFSPKVIFVFAHMDDVLGTALLALIHKHTKTKVYFFNHGSHAASLGFNFADLVIEGMPATSKFTKTERGINRNHVMGLPSRKKDDTEYFSADVIKQKRAEWGVKEDRFVTLSGGAGYKFFSGGKSPYFEMVKSLLLKEPKLHHIIVSHFNKKQQKIIDGIFADSPELKARLTNIPFSTNFDLLFQACDVYVDSFPFSSALTQIDVMRNKRPSIVKINAENPIFSFHEYLPENYPYMFENIAEMEAATLKLLYSKEERDRVIDILYRHYMENYEGDVVRDKYTKIIEAADSVEKLYQ